MAEGWETQRLRDARRSAVGVGFLVLKDRLEGERRFKFLNREWWRADAG